VTNPSIGVAVIGGGMAGRAHAAGYRSASTLFGTERPDVRLVAIADTNEAVADLKQGDVLLIAGKGHETGQIVKGAIFPYSDHDAVDVALKGGAKRA